MPDTLITQTISTTDARVLINCPDNPLVSIEVSSTWAGALNIETNLDPDNPVWRAGKVFTEAGAAASAAPTANGRWIIQAAGVGQVRARLNPATSGAAVVTLRAGDNETFGIGGTGGTGGGGGAVTVTNPADFVDGWDATQGLTTSAGITTDINGTAQGFRRGNIKQWIAYLARFPAALGSTTASASLPVTLSTDGQFTTSTGSLTETAPATDIASSGLNGRLQRIAQRLTSLIALLPTALGTTTAAGSLPVTLASDSTYATLQGGVTETAPATDIASSGANGRLQRIAQRLSSLIAFFGLTNNNAAPGANHIGVLTGLANATAPTWTEGNETVASFTLRGDQRVSAGGYTPAAPVCTFTRGANTTAYTIGDEVGTASTAPTAVTVGRFNGASGVIQGAQVVYSSFAATTPQLVLLLFSATVTLAGDNAQLNLSDSDAKLLIGIIPLTASQSGQYSAGAAVSAGNTIFTGAPTAPIHFTCAGGAQTIFACLITLNAFTPIANSETLDILLQVEGN